MGPGYPLYNTLLMISLSEVTNAETFVDKKKLQVELWGGTEKFSKWLCHWSDLNTKPRS